MNQTTEANTSANNGKWKHVEVELPRENVLVHCLLGNSRIVCPLFCFRGMWFTPDEKLYCFGSPTHWQYMTNKEMKDYRKGYILTTKP